MTYDRVHSSCNKDAFNGAIVNHLAELVRGYFVIVDREGPLIRPSATFSPRGEGHPARFAAGPFTA
jgi:hypothetical protein